MNYQANQGRKAPVGLNRKWDVGDLARPNHCRVAPRERRPPELCRSSEWRYVSESCLHRFLGLMAVLLVGCGLTTGCASRGGVLGVDCCADVPAGAIPEPAGTKVCNWQTEQVGSAIADQTILYQADFVSDTTALSPSALGRMSRHVQSGLATAQTWLIEPSGDESLDSQRVAKATEELVLRGVTSMQVQVATPAALGLRGPQAEQAARVSGNARSSNSGSGAPISSASALGRQASRIGGLF